MIYRPTRPFPISCAAARSCKNATTLAEAESILRALGGGLGWNLLISDARNRTAAVLEVSAGHQGVVRAWEEGPPGERDAVWTTNHFNAFPGFRGHPEHDPGNPAMVPLEF